MNRKESLMTSIDFLKENIDLISSDRLCYLPIALKIQAAAIRLVEAKKKAEKADNYLLQVAAWDQNRAKKEAEKAARRLKAPRMRHGLEDLFVGASKSFDWSGKADALYASLHQKVHNLRRTHGIEIKLSFDTESRQQQIIATRTM